MISEAIAFLASERRFSEIRDHLGVTNGYAGELLHRAVKYGLVERTRRGHYRALDPVEEREEAA